MSADGGCAGGRLTSSVTGTTVSLSVLAPIRRAKPTDLYLVDPHIAQRRFGADVQRQSDQRRQEHDGHVQFRGQYVFLVTITNASGLSTTNSVSVTVDQTLTSFSITAPSHSGSGADGAVPFVATALDQFGIAMANQSLLPWSLNGNGIDFNSPAGATVNLDGASPGFAT